MNKKPNIFLSSAFLFSAAMFYSILILEQTQNLRVTANISGQIVNDVVRSTVYLYQVKEVHTPATDGWFGGSTKYFYGKIRATGIIITNNGFVLTAKHVVDQMTADIPLLVVPTGTDGRMNRTCAWKPSKYLVLQDWDLAILVPPNKQLCEGSAYLRFANRFPVAGERIEIYGYPTLNKNPENAGPITRSNGKVLGEVTTTLGGLMTETDAICSPGESGGPVIDSNGELLGIVSMKSGKIEGCLISVAERIIPTLNKELINEGYAPVAPNCPIHAHADSSEESSKCICDENYSLDDNHNCSRLAPHPSASDSPKIEKVMPKTTVSPTVAVPKPVPSAVEPKAAATAVSTDDTTANSWIQMIQDSIYRVYYDLVLWMNYLLHD